MTYMLNSIDEAIDRKFLVVKTLTNQVEAGTIVHIMGASEQSGVLTVYYRITYTNQDYSVKFDSLKAFCKWARPDNFIARHYESLNIHEIQQYIRVKDRTMTSFCLPIMLAITAIILIASLILFGDNRTVGLVIGAILSVAACVGVFFFYRSMKRNAMVRLYSKVSAKSNWGVNFK